MAQLVLFDNREGPGPDEWVVIDVDMLSDAELESEYMAKVKERLDIGPISSAWPVNTSLAE